MQHSGGTPVVPSLFAVAAPLVLLAPLRGRHLGRHGGHAFSRKTSLIVAQKGVHEGGQQRCRAGDGEDLIPGQEGGWQARDHSIQHSQHGNVMGMQTGGSA